MFNFRSVFSLDASIASSKKQYCLVNKLEDFSEDEGGIATVWAVFWLILCFSISGLAVDVTNAWKVHTILQSTADITALAGVYELSEFDNASAKGKVEIQAGIYANLNMNQARYGNVLDPADVRVGYWDGTTFEVMTDISEGTDPANAVQTITRQTGANGSSAVGTFFLKFVGFDRFTVKTGAIANMFVSSCDYDGMIAFGDVNLSTGQRFYDKFCVHGEKGLNAAHDNIFGTGVIVSTPTFELCGQSAIKCADPLVVGEREQNPGLFDAWRAQSLFPSAEPVEANGNGNGNGNSTSELTGKPAKIGEYTLGLLGLGDPKYIPDYIDNPAASAVVTIDLSGNGQQIKTINEFFADKDMVDGFESGTVYNITCKQGTNVNLGPVDGENWNTISGVVIVGSNCDFVFDPSVTYYDIVIATSSTSQTTFSGPSGVTLGHYDGCDDVGSAPVGTNGYASDSESGTYYGGAVTLLTAGSVHFSSKLSAYDMQIIAAQDVHLASKGPVNNGQKWVAEPIDELDESVHWGTTITTGGDISVSRAHAFVGCPGRPVTSAFFDVPLSYRLVR